MSCLTAAQKVLTALLLASAADRFCGSFSACSWQQGRQLCGRPPVPRAGGKPGSVWRTDTVSDGSLGFPDSRWLLRGKVWVTRSQVGLVGRPAFRCQNHQSLKQTNKQKMTVTLKPEQRTLSDAVQRKAGGRSSFNETT